MFHRSVTRWTVLDRPEINSFKISFKTNLRGTDMREMAFHYRYTDRSKITALHIGTIIVFSLHVMDIMLRHGMRPQQLDIMDHILTDESEIYDKYQCNTARSRLMHWIAKHSRVWGEFSDPYDDARQAWVALVLRCRISSESNSLDRVKPCLPIDRIIWSSYRYGQMRLEKVKERAAQARQTMMPESGYEPGKIVPITALLNNNQSHIM